MSGRTVITYTYAEITGRVVTEQNLSPDFIDTILDDIRKQVIAGARQLGMTYEHTEPAEADAEDTQA